MNIHVAVRVDIEEVTEGWKNKICLVWNSLFKCLYERGGGKEYAKSNFYFTNFLFLRMGIMSTNGWQNERMVLK